MKHPITTQKQLRAAFWGQSPCRQFYKVSYRQNDYSATVRCEWVDFVDMMRRDKQISEALAFRVTL